MAAAFALARPGIAGAVAGVAIATALVPPVCACGSSLATGFYLNAVGAAILFFTNLLAIVVASALTFMGMGVGVSHSFSRARRIARHGIAALVAVLPIMSIPLGMELGKQLDEGRAMPLAYPLTRALSRRLHERVAKDEGVRIMFLGRASVTEAVVVYLATEHDVSKAYRDELRVIVRDEMADPALVVHVLALESTMSD